MSFEDSSILHGSGKSIDVASAETAKKLLGTARVACRFDADRHADEFTSTKHICNCGVGDPINQNPVQYQSEGVSEPLQIKATIMSYNIKLPSNMCKEAVNTPTPVMKDPHDRSGHTETTTSFDDDDFPITKETFHASRLLRKDSIAVQKLHGPNDCEEHEKDPHLQDFLIPHHVVHMKRLDEDEPQLTAATTETDAESVSEESDADAAVTTPCRSCLRPETESYYDRPKTEKSKRKIHFGQVCVRDYDMILGDNPSVGYGPPVTIDWDYVEFNPIQMDEYEFHRPPRRSLREMGLNYYRRKHILALAGHTEEEFKVVKKEIKKWKTNRYLTRALVSSSIPFAKIEDSVESAVRKCRRLVKDDHWKSEKHLFVQ